MSFAMSKKQCPWPIYNHNKKDNKYQLYQIMEEGEWGKTDQMEIINMIQEPLPPTLILTLRISWLSL